ncbi:Hsp33 family molecular chaperone HslO [Cellulosilyticum sp. I15G10I2]|uniref:Hsp33 family molecular chaperone HslO n=1 Tax=Cellulosilyticum sp. I15G10I2 TaxID=1892843 RepID=UPI00085C53C7|nr:Hsp33 family molecular chaperone HslO [Cellulosilyticum sp. I15G10I2]
MKDYIIRGTDKERNFRFFGANTKNMISKACENHQTTPVVSAALGRTMTGAAMMGCMLKRDTDRVSISIKGDGPIGGIVVEADGKGYAKGYPYQSQVDIPNKPDGKLDVSGAIGNAMMTVIKDLGLKEPYTGQVAMLSGEIAEDFTFYFAVSEQTNSLVILGVLVDVDYSIKQSGGIIIQVLPDAKDEAITELENNLKNFTSLTTYLDAGETIEEIIKRLLEDIEIMEKTEVDFKCDCSKYRMERGLISIGRQELEEIASEEENIEIVCHFCNQKYDFSKDEIEKIIEAL